jgi:N-acetylglutamate synthase-like GNAT family acetyltransferase
LAGLEIRAATVRDAAPILELIVERMGSDFIDGEDLLKSLEDPEAINVCALVDEEIVGYGSATIENASDLVSLLDYTPEGIKVAERIGCLESVAVATKAEGQGIGTLLQKARVEQFYEMGLRFVYSTAWKSSKGVHVGGMLERQGFEPLKEIPDFYSEETTCPDCGLGVICHCSTVVYLKRL